MLKLWTYPELKFTEKHFFVSWFKVKHRKTTVLYRIKPAVQMNVLLNETSSHGNWGKFYLWNTLNSSLWKRVMIWNKAVYLSDRLWYYFGGTITTQIVWRVFRRLKNSDRKVECESDSDLRDDYMLTLKTESDNG